MKSNDKMEIQNGKGSRFKKIIKCITVEPVLFSITIPSCLLSICLQNLMLVKACRVNLEFPDLVCDNMMDKALNKINCGDVSDRQQWLLQNFTNHPTTMFTNQIDRWNNNTDFNSTNHDFEMEVCRAERESQKLGSTINAYIAPFDSTISIVIVLFAGSWSDKSGKRKACILLPQIGQFVGQTFDLIGAIFMKQLPVEFNSILGTLLPAISGGSSLLMIGLFSYLTEVTEEKDRVFRFGIMYQICPLLAICSLPFSGILFQKLGYIKLISVCMLIIFVGILYVVFVMGEAKRPVKKDNDEELTEMFPKLKSPENGSIELVCTANEAVTHTKENMFSNVIRACATVIVRKRSGNGRKIIYLILAIVTLSTALDYEYTNEYYFVRTKLNWEALEEAPYAAYGSATFFIGTTFMVAVLIKYFKVTDTILALISSSFSVVAKVICITVTTTFMLYVAVTVDMFCGIRSLVVRSIISTVVDNTEIGKIYSVIGVLENLSRFIFVPIYSNIYKYTVDTFPNAYFICSLAIIIVVTILCCILHRWVDPQPTSGEVSGSQPTNLDKQ